MIGFVFAPILKLLHIILGVSTAQNFPPPLDTKEEEETFRLARTGAEEVRREARQKLILHNLRLVSHIVRKYYATAKNQEDLVSIGTIGLVKAVDSFKFGFVELFAMYFSVNSDRKVPKEHRQRAGRPLDTRFPYMGLFDRGDTRARIETYLRGASEIRFSPRPNSTQGGRVPCFY